jgi:hypothetical protein
MTPDTSRKLEIDWLKTAGGAFAAVSSAFLLSTLGAAGTIIGAALGSVIVTVGGALYSQGLARSHDRLAQVQTAAMRKVGVAQADVRRAARHHRGGGEAVDGHLAQAEERLEDVKDDLGAMADEPTGPGWREGLVLLPWKRISLIAAGLFATAVLAITAFELIAGQSVSSITGGSEGDDGPTISRIGGGSDGDTSNEDDKPPPDEASPTDAPSDEPSDQPTPTDVPTGEPTSTPEASPASTPTAPMPTTAPPTSEPTLPTDPATTPPAG